MRPLLDNLVASGFKYLRDLTLHPGSSIGEHPHTGDDENYFFISGSGRMKVDGEEELRILVVCAQRGAV